MSSSQKLARPGRSSYRCRPGPAWFHTDVIADTDLGGKGCLAHYDRTWLKEIMSPSHPHIYVVSTQVQLDNPQPDSMQGQHQQSRCCPGNGSCKWAVVDPSNAQGQSRRRSTPPLFPPTPPSEWSRPQRVWGPIKNKKRGERVGLKTGVHLIPLAEFTTLLIFFQLLIDKNE